MARQTQTFVTHANPERNAFVALRTPDLVKKIKNRYSHTVHQKLKKSRTTIEEDIGETIWKK
jgi:hypothetical protein